MIWIACGLIVCFLLILVLIWKKRPWEKAVYKKIITFPDASSMVADSNDPNQLETCAKIFTIAPIIYQDLQLAVSNLEKELKTAIHEEKGSRITDHLNGQIYAYNQILSMPQRMQDKYNELKLKAEGE